MKCRKCEHEFLTKEIAYEIGGENWLCYDCAVVKQVCAVAEICFNLLVAGGIAWGIYYLVKKCG